MNAVNNALGVALPLAALAGLVSLLGWAMETFPVVAEAVAPWIR